MAFSPSRAPVDFLPGGIALDIIVQKDEKELASHPGCTWDAAADYIDKLLNEFSGRSVNQSGDIKKVAEHENPHRQCYFDDCAYEMGKNDRGYTIESKDRHIMYIDAVVSHLIRKHHLWDKAVGKLDEYVRSPAEFYEHFMGGYSAAKEAEGQQELLPVDDEDIIEEPKADEVPAKEQAAEGAKKAKDSEKAASKPAEAKGKEPANKTDKKPAYEQSDKFKRVLSLVDKVQATGFFRNVYYHAQDKSRTEDRKTAAGVVASNAGQGMLYFGDEGLMFMQNVMRGMEHQNSVTRTINGVAVNKRGYKSKKYGVLSAMHDTLDSIRGDYVGYFFEVEGVSCAVVGQKNQDCQFEEYLKTIIDYIKANS